MVGMKHLIHTWVRRQSQRHLPESRTRAVREENKSENVRKLKN